MSQAHVLSVTHTRATQGQQWSSSPVRITTDSDAFGRFTDASSRYSANLQNQ